MKIEAGKYYITRDGEKVGPMVPDCVDGKDWKQKGDRSRLWHDDGQRWNDDRHDELIAEWTDTPTLWKDMTPAEKGALLLAHHEGKVIEVWHRLDGWVRSVDFGAVEYIAYRVKPTVETVTINGRNTSIGWEWISANPSYHTHRITFQTIDGKPDTSSIRMEELK